jgi:hypothetical protein
MGKSRAQIKVTGAQINVAKERAREFEQLDRRAVEATYEKRPDLITIHLDDGVRVSIPRRLLQGLENGRPGQLSNMELLGRGTGIHWPELGVDHYVPGLLNHVFGTGRWMAELGRRGGSSTSHSKAAAARANGKKGGRPKRAA